jgi:hypothetical protein
MSTLEVGLCRTGDTSKLDIYLNTGKPEIVMDVASVVKLVAELRQLIKTAQEMTYRNEMLSDKGISGEPPPFIIRGKRNGFREDLSALLNIHSMENSSNTPDFILAGYMLSCLDAFDTTVERREEWYGRK